MSDFSLRASSAIGRGGNRNKIWHKGSLGGEDDARTSNNVHIHRESVQYHT